MPNHVTNILTFTGSVEAIKELRQKCKGETSPFSFQAFYPMPQELLGTTCPAKIVSEAELQEWIKKKEAGELSEWERDYRPITEKEQKELRAKYGYDNWYDWHLANWGTKWDCYSFIDNEDSIQFETAWSTPMLALMELSVQCPDVVIHVKYADEDFGNNVGTYTLEGGHLQDIFQPDYSKESIQLAMDIQGDKDYWLYDRLTFDFDLDMTELDDFHTWLVEIAHEEGNLSEDYPPIVLDKLLELAVRDEQYERAGTIKQWLKMKLNYDNLNQ